MSAEISLKDEAAGVIGFPGFEVDLGRGELRINSKPVPLRPKTFRVLECLARHPGILVARQTLVDAVWPDVVVTDDSLVQCIAELRAAFDDRSQQKIRTVPRRGYMLDVQPLSPAGRTKAPAAATRHTAWIATVAGLALCFAAAGAWWWSDSHDVRGRDAREGRITLAILPFANLGGDPGQDFFADGITADLIAAASRLPDTFVIAQGSSAAYANARVDPRQAGRELGARFVVAGGVQRSGDTVRIQARLTSVSSGAVVWADTLEYGNEKPWNWRSEIAPRIGRALRGSVVDEVGRRAAEPDEPHGSIEHTMRGYSLMRAAASLAELDAAIAEFQRALRVDPGSSSAWSGLSIALSGQILSRWVHRPEEKLDAAERAAASALRADLTNPGAHFAHGQVLRLRGRLQEALAAFEECTALDPSFVFAHARMAYVHIELGRAAEALTHVDQALRLSPTDPKQWQPLFAAGMALFHLGRDDEAYSMMEKAAAKNPRIGFPYMWMAAIDALHGRDADARANLARYMDRIPLHTVHELRATEVSTHPVFLAQRERFYEGLRKAGLPQ